MTRLLKFSLLLTLLLAQLLAPLLHAHVGGASHSGLHVPGLEAWAQMADGQGALISAPSVSSPSEEAGLWVGMAEGAPQAALTPADLPPLECTTAALPVIPPSLPVPFNHAPPPDPQRLTHYASRAPPAF